MGPQPPTPSVPWSKVRDGKILAPPGASALVYAWLKPSDCSPAENGWLSHESCHVVKPYRSESTVLLLMTFVLFATSTFGRRRSGPNHWDRSAMNSFSAFMSGVPGSSVLL